MAEHVYTTLREANRVRQAEWTGGQEVDILWRGNELGGEVGEALNVVKKLARERRGWPGSRATVDELAAELADVVICADLLAMTENIDLDAAVAAKFNATSEKVGLATRYEPGGVSSDYAAAVMFLTDLSQRLAAGQNVAQVSRYAACAVDAIACVIAGPGGKLTLTEEPTPCEACGGPMVEGDAYYSDLVNGGVLHADCVGPEPEGFTDGDGNPLAPDAPIPAPLIWSEPT